MNSDKPIYISRFNYDYTDVIAPNLFDDHDDYGGIEIEKCIFYRNGCDPYCAQEQEKVKTQGWGSAVFHSNNLKNCPIINNLILQFQSYLIKDGQMAPSMGSHVFYLHQFQNNLIENNVFAVINSNPIKLRNQSNSNIIKNNQFYYATGLSAAVVYAQNNNMCKEDDGKEEPLWCNWFYDNTVQCRFESLTQDENDEDNNDSYNGDNWCYYPDYNPHIPANNGSQVWIPNILRQAYVGNTCPPLKPYSERIVYPDSECYWNTAAGIDPVCLFNHCFYCNLADMTDETEEVKTILTAYCNILPDSADHCTAKQAKLDSGFVCNKIKDLDAVIDSDNNTNWDYFKICTEGKLIADPKGNFFNFTEYKACLKHIDPFVTKINEEGDPEPTNNFCRSPYPEGFLDSFFEHASGSSAQLEYLHYYMNNLLLNEWIYAFTFMNTIWGKDGNPLDQPMGLAMAYPQNALNLYVGEQAPSYLWMDDTISQTEIQMDSGTSFSDPIRVQTEGMFYHSTVLDNLGEGAYFTRVVNLETGETSEPKIIVMWGEDERFDVDSETMSMQSMSTEPVDPPTPHNAEFCNEPVILSVGKAGNTLEWDLEITIDPSFNTITGMFASISGSSFEIPVQLPWGIYYWRVKPTGNKTWGLIRKFEVSK